ncbi:EamA family transporter [Tabrizicola piscis]|uniref:EamA family transporter n=1 Tax=Tabrizicola piscis TaxID=2494374 RepID=A0A3S8U9E5_9RHOB|nr:EamA family transporter [Tabrizicola piscis]AZL60208.1 EamA family transporter [Tabrizicola piscis]
MHRTADISLTALAPVVWGSTYLVTTETLPDGFPLTVAALRALPAGLLLLVMTRSLPPRALFGRLLVLGALNFAVFWACLFVAAYRLPGGAAATLGALQALMVIGFARWFLGTAIQAVSVLAAIFGVLGVALLLLGSDTGYDLIGILAAICGTVSMAAGTVLSRKWQPQVPVLSFTAWQLTAGGLLLLPVALLAEPSLPPLTATNLLGLVWLGLIGAAATYGLWLRGIARLGPSPVAMLGMLSPVTAVVLGWVWLGESLTAVQLAGAAIVLASIWVGQTAARRAEIAPATLRGRRGHRAGGQGR